MAKGVTLGYLRFILGLDTLSFRKGMTQAEKDLWVMQKRFEKVGSSMASIGARMTVGISAPLAALATKGIREARETADAMGQVNAALASMGPVAGRSAEQLSKAADAFEGKSLYEADEILRKVTANMLTFGNVAGANFDRAQQASLDVATALRQDLQSASVMVGKALNDPVRGLTALTRVGIQFTDQQKEQIKTMAEAGDVAGAQAIILGELERQFRKRALAAQESDPWNKVADAFNNLAETVGTALIPVLDALAPIVTNVFNAFSSMSPEMQKWTVYALAGAAAFGPLLSVLGNVVLVVSSLAPVVAALSSAFSILTPTAAAAGTATAAAGAAAVPLAPILGAVAVAALAIYAAYKHWDEIGAWIDGVKTRTSAAASEINTHLKSITDGADEMDRRLGLPTKGEFFASVSRWAKQTWADLNQYDLAAWADRADEQLAQLATSAAASMQRLYAGVKTWLQDKLDGVLNWLAGKLGWAGDLFFKLYDRVVGHSYIPDMIDQIGEHMRRLDAEMFKPAQDATSKTGEAFQRLSGLLARLFPEQALYNQFKAELAQLRADAAASKMPVDQLAEAVARLRREYAGVPIDGAVPLSEGFDPGSLIPANFDSGMDRIVDAMPQIVDKAKEWRDVMQQVGGDLLQKLRYDLTAIIDGSMKLKDLWRSLLAFGLQALTSPQSPLNALIAGKRELGGPVLAGSAYLVGERGPEIFTPTRGGHIFSNDHSRRLLDGGRGDVTMNVYTNDADSFRRSERQINRDLRRRVG